MNTEYVWWVVVLFLVGGGAIAFLALGRVPDIGDRLDDWPEGESEGETEGETPPDAVTTVDGPARAEAGDAAGTGQSLPVNSTVSASDEPAVTSETP